MFRREKPVVADVDLSRDGQPCVVEVLAVLPLGGGSLPGEPPTEVTLQVCDEGARRCQAQVGLHLPDAAVPVVIPGARLPGRWLPGADLVTIDLLALQS